MLHSYRPDEHRLHQNQMTAEDSDAAVVRLVGNLYEQAPIDQKAWLIEYLLRPLGVLSAVGVAHGAFAKIRIRSPGPDIEVRPDDIRSLSTEDVITLVQHVQQARTEVIDGLSQLPAALRPAAGPKVAPPIRGLLVQHSSLRHGLEADLDE